MGQDNLSAYPPLDQATTLHWSRYASLAALVILLWDHCLTFKQEVELIWPSRANFVKRVFLVNRYLVPVVLSFNMHSQSGLNVDGLSDNFCRVWSMIVFVLAAFSIATSQWLIILKLWRLWGGKRDVIIYMLLGYLVLQVGCLILIGLTAHQAWPLIGFNLPSRMCALTEKPQILRGFYAWLLLFEVITWITVCYNGLSRPRDGSELLVKVLHRDGILFFTITVIMRVLNLIMAVLDIPTQIFLGIYCIWGVVTTIVSRMIIDAREAEIGSSGETLADDETWSVKSVKSGKSSEFSDQTKVAF